MPQFLDNVLQALRMRNVFNPRSPGGDFPGSNIPGATPPIVPWDVGVRMGQETIPRINEMPPGNPQINAPSKAQPMQVRSAMQQQPDINPLMQYQPETRAQDQLYQMLQQFPQRNNPNLLRKIAAIAASFNGPEAVERTLYAPYIREMQEFQPRFEATKEAANQERLMNTNLRQIATAAAQNEALNRRLDIQTQQAATAAQNAQSNRIRATAYDYAQRNPNSTFEMDNQGRLIAIDPRTNQMEYVIDPDTGNPVTGSDLPAALMENLRQRGRMQLEAARTAGDIKVEGVRQQGREAIEETRGETRGWNVANVPDPNDPTKTIGIRYNEITGEVQPLQLGGKPVAGITTPSARAGTTQQPANLAAIRQMSQDALDALNGILVNGKLTGDAKAAVGMSSYASILPTTQARTGRNKIDRLKNLITLEMISEMKRQSRTGATGFGALNLRELGVLENSAATLDPGMNEADFEKEVIRIKERLEKVLQDPSGTTEDAEKKPSAADLIKKYGGQ